jgi:kinetochore protein Spc7/SPC105
MPNGSAHPVNGEGSPISLTYIADAHEYQPRPLTIEKRFFLQIMRVQLQCVQQSQTKIKDLLDFVSSNWRKATMIIEEARALGVSYITESTITADEVMAIRSILLLRSMRTKIEVTFEVKVQNGEGVTGLDIKLTPSARVVYGEDLKEKKLGGFLEQKAGVETWAEADGGVWARAVRDLEGKLLSRGKK